MTAESSPKLFAQWQKIPEGYELEIYTKPEAWIGYLSVALVRNDEGILIGDMGDIQVNTPRRGLGSKLYRAAAAELFQFGVKTLDGEITTSEEALLTRRFVFGEDNLDLTDFGDKNFSFEEAIAKVRENNKLIRQNRETERTLILVRSNLEIINYTSWERPILDPEAEQELPDLQKLLP